MRTQNTTIPLAHKNITTVHKSVRNTHIAQPFLGMFQFFQQFEIAGGYYYLAGGESLHLLIIWLFALLAGGDGLSCVGND
jgi:thiosulfate reductase cytochrome b subunit